METLPAIFMRTLCFWGVSFWAFRELADWVTDVTMGKEGRQCWWWERGRGVETREAQERKQAKRGE